MIPGCLVGNILTTKNRVGNLSHKCDDNNFFSSFSETKLNLEIRILFCLPTIEITISIVALFSGNWSSIIRVEGTVQVFFLKNVPTPACFSFIFVLFQHKFSQKKLWVGFSRIWTQIVGVESMQADHLTTTTTAQGPVQVNHWSLVFFLYDFLIQRNNLLKFPVDNLIKLIRV